ETLAERVDTLLAIRDLHRAHGHIQEVIVQNFRAKPTIALADAPEPDAADVARTVAVARLVLDPEVSVQAPPNLSPDDHALLRRRAPGVGGATPPPARHPRPPGPRPPPPAPPPPPPPPAAPPPPRPSPLSPPSTAGWGGPAPPPRPPGGGRPPCPPAAPS